MIPLFLFTHFSVLITLCSSTSLGTDFHSLISLKNEFQFPEPMLSSWNASDSSSVCSWSGIGCFGGRVVSLDLTNMGLYGEISPEISKIEKLSNLSLAGNNFTGGIEMVNLCELRFLNISNNGFEEKLDWNYSCLANLEVLDACNNNFTGFLPTGIVGLKNLRHLDLGGNYFYGRIPPSYGWIKSLEYLQLDYNDLHGRIPKELGNLTNLKEFHLGNDNVFEGGIPPEFGNLVNLEVMDLSHCELDGQIPPELGNLKSINTLYLYYNLLSGPIPKQLGNLTNLENLDLSGNELTGEILPEFINLKKLKLLNLFLNHLHGPIPDYVTEFPDLETLQLWKNNFTGTIPGNLGRNGNLQLLDLSSNKLTGIIPRGLCSSKKLRILVLMNNFLFGPVPGDLGKCYSLTRLRMGENYLNGSVPDGLIFLPELNLAELQSNYLTGALPENGDSSSKPVNLVQLNLSNNRLSGTLPISISDLSSIETLLLGGNQFSGQILASIGKLRGIVKLDFSRNSFSGVIPPEIGNCTHLTFLDMSQNHLSGSIPPEISNIHILSYLNLSRNHLNASIPKSIGSLNSLSNADFSFNEFSGKLPDSGQFAAFNASSFAGNPQLCGPLLNNPCNFTTMTKTSKKSNRDFKLIFALGLLMCSLVFAVAAIIKAKSFKKTGPGRWKMTAFQKLEFNVSDILNCVENGNMIGRGGAGIVYHGKMANGVEIAVKKLLGFSPHGHDHGFRAEIQTLGNIRHRNIVRLLAFCTNKETNLLVYEYMRNGSLGEALHGKKGAFLGWNLRYKIANEAARGMSYLHHDCSPLIVHRDVKSNNILLDLNFEAHVADFGLAKFFQGGASECMSVIAGSYGYIAPEYAYTLKVDEKSDVYSFGIVLLELLTGRKPVGEFGEGVDIVQWVKRATNFHREDVNLIIDPRLIEVPKEEAMHLFFIAILCIQEYSVERPAMKEVVQMLSEFPQHSPDYESSSSFSIGHKQSEYLEKQRLKT